MKNKAYILQPDTKAYFPNWDKMTKEEQQKWENEFEAMKKKSKPAIWNPDKAAEGVYCPTCKNGLTTTTDSRSSARGAHKNCMAGLTKENTRQY